MLVLFVFLLLTSIDLQKPFRKGTFEQKGELKNYSGARLAGPTLMRQAQDHFHKQ